jgi:hypothetical protein
MKQEQYIIDVIDGDPDDKVWKLPLTEVPVSSENEFSRRDKLPEPFNQGSLGSCVGCSGAGVVSDEDYLLLNDPSPMWIYRRAQFYDVWPGEDYSGTSIAGACKVLQKEGCCSEAFWPYVANKDTSAKDGADEEASKAKITAYYKLPMQEVNQIKDALRTKTLWFSYDIYKQFYTIKSDGILKTEGYMESEKSGGHAVALIGWKYIDDKLFWEVRNSWGTRWGNKGHFWIEHGLLEKIIHGGMYVITINEPAPKRKRTSRIARFFNAIVDKFKYFGNWIKGLFK